MVGMVRQAGCGEGSEGVRSHARNPSDSPSKGPCPCAGPASSYVFALEAKLGRHGGPTRMGSAHTLAGGTQGKGAGVEPHRIAWSLHSRPAAASQGAGSQQSGEAEPAGPDHPRSQVAAPW